MRRDELYEDGRCISVTVMHVSWVKAGIGGVEGNN